MTHNPQPPTRQFLQVPADHPPANMLRARGNLDYLGFIRLVQQLWLEATGTREDGTARIPLRATGTDLNDPDYPCILYSLELRKPFTNEAKPKIREILDLTSTHKMIVSAQRFENIVQFSVVDSVASSGAQRVEEIIEAFEDFMMQYTPIFKEVGLSDIFYAQRRTDRTEERSGFSVVRRSITYLVITEKVLAKEVWRLNDILVSARTYLVDNQPQQATPSYEGLSYEIEDQFAATPNS